MVWLLPPPGLTVNFWIIFALLLSVSFRSKMRVPRLLVTVRLFCLLKTVSSFLGIKNNSFLGGAHTHSSHPTSLNTYDTSPPPYWNPKYTTGINNRSSIIPSIANVHINIEICTYFCTCLLLNCIWIQFVTFHGVYVCNCASTLILYLGLRQSSILVLCWLS